MVLGVGDLPPGQAERAQGVLGEFLGFKKREVCFRGIVDTIRGCGYK